MNRFDRPRQILAIGLAGLAGYVDAVGFLSADAYFVSFMSGNTTRLAVQVAQDWRTAATPAGLIAGFVCGVALGTYVAERAGRWRKVAVIGLVACLLLAAAALRHGEASLVLTTGLLVLAMGAINNTFRRDGEVAVGLTYMTGALVRLGQGIGGRLAGRPTDGWRAHGLLWLGLASGGVIGALAFIHLGSAALWMAAIYAALATVAAWWLAQSEV